MLIVMRGDEILVLLICVRYYSLTFINVVMNTRLLSLHIIKCWPWQNTIYYKQRKNGIHLISLACSKTDFILHCILSWSEFPSLLQLLHCSTASSINKVSMHCFELRYKIINTSAKQLHCSRVWTQLNPRY